WHGGMEGGNAVADLVLGDSYPSGKLSDTIAYNIEDYPSTANFGDTKENFYKEDIYVGYRYFETFCPERVMYPFGFGLGYTDFEIEINKAFVENDVYNVEVSVKNIGETQGKEVVQLYYSAPQGKLGKPKLELGAYVKTKELSAGEEEKITLKMPIELMASFDDSGVTDNKNCLVLESGEYNIFVGKSVRNIKFANKYFVGETVVLKQLNEAVAPQKAFDRIKPLFDGDKFTVSYENTPTAEIDVEKRAVERRKADIPYTGDKGYKLVDVADGKCTMRDFVAQLSIKDMRDIVKGEGMNSHKVTAGTGAAFGGVSDSLLELGIPVACATDGPSGVRLDSGAKATAIPIGTLLACSFNDDMVEKMHKYFGLELRANKVDALLGPGMNIHRNPLNGRNFEYFSEDPLLTGKMAAAVCRGLATTGTTATIKHFACNNQETARYNADSVVSARALREIYLKGFEIAVKEGGATSLMTGYNSLNGYWCAGNYDLDTIILRDEWNFKGMVMTDWWAKMNCKNGEAFRSNTKQMVRARNDIYMVCKAVEAQPDNIEEGLQEGHITLANLQYCCMDLLDYIIKSPTFEEYVLGGCKKPVYSSTDDSNMSVCHLFENVINNEEYDIDIAEEGNYVFIYNAKVEADELAQFYCNVMLDDGEIDGMSLSGTNGKEVSFKQPVKLPSGKHKFKVVADDKLVMTRIEIKK
ncbi:MAG: fibronectin type III-like domain-contianing protein, partial [Clostridia bacterium]|nr:fibronectin type III-like domain-contianing protein [Clostridia bacterium]